jgi:hypothetical protein
MIAPPSVPLNGRSAVDIEVSAGIAVVAARLSAAVPGSVALGPVSTVAVIEAGWRPGPIVLPGWPFGWTVWVSGSLTELTPTATRVQLEVSPARWLVQAIPAVIVLGVALLGMAGLSLRESPPRDPTLLWVVALWACGVVTIVALNVTRARRVVRLAWRQVWPAIVPPVAPDGAFRES